MVVTKLVFFAYVKQIFLKNSNLMRFFSGNNYCFLGRFLAAGDNTGSGMSSFTDDIPELSIIYIKGLLF